MRPRCWICTLVAVLAMARTLAASPEQPGPDGAADRSTVGVLGFVAGDDYPHAVALKRALERVLEASTRFRPAEGHHSLEVLTAALDCPTVPDAACLRQIQQRTHLARFLWGVLWVKDGKVRVRLDLVGKHGESKRTDFEYSASMTDRFDEDLLKVADSGLGALLGELRYPVEIHSRARQGIVELDGKRVGRLIDGQAKMATTFGEHRISLLIAGRPPLVQTFRVHLGRLTRVRLDTPQAPGSQFGSMDARRGGAASGNMDSDSGQDSSSARSTAGWIATAAGAGLIVGGVAAALQIDSLNGEKDYLLYRAGLEPDQDACREAERDHVVPGAMAPDGVRAVCRQAATLEILQYVAFVLGSVSGATGIYLLSTSSEPATEGPKKTAARGSIAITAHELRASLTMGF